MSPRRLVVTSGALVIASVIAVVLLAGGGSERYQLRLKLANSSGLRKGVEVRIGGLRAGEVSSVRLTPDDKVSAVLELDDGQGPVGRDASVAIRPLNLLGQNV